MFQAIERSAAKGYQLVNRSSYWEFIGPRGSFVGNLKQVCTFAVIEQGFLFGELQIAVEEMERALHDAAEFGVFKRFMYTYDQGEKDENTSIH
jgi:hypothetical protein